jgi:hypothetical protein
MHVVMYHYQADEFDESMLKCVASFIVVVNKLGHGGRIIRHGESDPVFAMPTPARAAAVHAGMDDAKITQHHALILDLVPCLVRSFPRAHARKNEGVYTQFGAFRYASNRFVGFIFRLIPSYRLFPSYGLLTPQAMGKQQVSDKACGVKENRAYELGNPADPKALWLTQELHAVSPTFSSFRTRF